MMGKEYNKAVWKMEVGRRLRKEITKRYGYRRENVFAKDIGISQGSLSDIINGHSSPSAETLSRMIHHSTINIKGLLKWGWVR